MDVVLGVRFREVGKLHYFLHPEGEISLGDMVVAETKRGVECGKVIYVKENYPHSKAAEPGEKIIRKADEEDMKSLEIKKIEEAAAEKICKKKIKDHKLKMKVIEVEYIFDRSKLIFYFISHLFQI